jgi:hypothetical protein
MDILPVPFWEEHPDEYMQLFRTLADYIEPGPGWGWVVPTFQQGVDWTNGHFYSGCLVVNGPGVVWEDVPYGELSDDDSFLNDIGSWMRITNDYAVNKRGFVGAFPTMFTGYYPAGKGRVCGTVFLTSEAAEWHDVSKFVQGKCVIDDINNIPARFRGTQRFVENIPGGRFVGGFPNLYHRDTINGDTFCGTLLLYPSAARFEWFQTPPVHEDGDGSPAHPRAV